MHNQNILATKTALACLVALRNPGASSASALQAYAYASVMVFAKCVMEESNTSESSRFSTLPVDVISAENELVVQIGHIQIQILVGNRPYSNANSGSAYMHRSSVLRAAADCGTFNHRPAHVKHGFGRRLDRVQWRMLA